eukprot:GHVP01051524.1.p1 GENE.GHVP01051524.1~~GHVP01051524.1.p1  ORF type:complete len:415 (-),score=87.92 GHVP01051524.1:12-1256(-)
MDISNDEMMAVYNISGYKHTNITKELSKKKLKKVKEWRGRIELIKGFSFPTAATKLRFTPDGRSLIGAGVYPSLYKVFNLGNLTTQYERSVSSEILEIICLGDDGKNLVLMGTNGLLEFHNERDRIETVKIPFDGRGMFYNRDNCENVVFGSSCNAIPFDLNVGRFTREFETRSPNIRSGCYSNIHGMYVFGGSKGNLSFFDSRCSNKEIIEPLKEINNKNIGIDSLCFMEDGLNLMVGKEDGVIDSYDIRGTEKIFTKDHFYGEPIIKIVQSEDFVLSSDRKVIRIWYRKTGKTKGSIESNTDINDFCVDLGYIGLACEEEEVQSFYIPELGVSPRWADAIDGIIDSIEKRDDEKAFVTELDIKNKETLEKAVPVMHGYIINENIEDATEENKDSSKKAKNRKKTKKVASVWG